MRSLFSIPFVKIVYRKEYACNNFDMNWYLKCARNSENKKALPNDGNSSSKNASTLYV